MLGSFKIGRVLGITVRMHWSFPGLLLVTLLMSDVGWALAFVQFVMLFGVVFLHELGHSLVAKHYGIQVVDITFWPLGGMARMSEIPESPKVEGLIAIGGPAVNFVLAAFAAPLVLASFQVGGWSALFAPGFTVAWFSTAFLTGNLLLGLFNLIPAFPMDGGRVLRAFLGTTTDWLSATRRAVKVGRIFAVLMIVGPTLLALKGIGTASLFPMPLIGVFVWFGGSMELWAVRMRHGDVPGRVGPRPAYFEARAPSATAKDRLDPSGARRPVIWGDPRGALDADAIARLESYQGRLRNAAPPEQP